MDRKKLAALATAGLIAAVAAAAIGLRAFGPALVLRLDEDVPVTLRGRIPLRAAIDQPVDVTLQKDVAAKVALGRVSIPIDTRFSVPLDFALDVPLDTEVALDDTLELHARVAIDTVLTERELELSQLAIPMDSDVFVDDTIAIEVVVPVNSEVTTLLGVKVPVHMNVPVKARVPIHQKVHVHDVLKVSVPKLRVPLHLTLPVSAQVPLKRSLRVRGNVHVPVKRRIEIPVKQLLALDLAQPLPVQVKLEGSVPATLRAELDANVSIDQAIPARLGAIVIEPHDISLERAKSTHQSGPNL